VVSYSASAHDALDHSVTPSCTPASPATFAPGTTIVHCTATDSVGQTAAGSFKVTVGDTTPPTILSVTPSPASLWPPNHQMITVTVSVAATDLVDPHPGCTITGATSSQPGAGDIQMTGGLTIGLRADRTGGTSRVYTLTVRCADASGNAASRTAAVVVPANQGARK
jgi:hypothetical protein